MNGIQFVFLFNKSIHILNEIYKKIKNKHAWFVPVKCFYLCLFTLNKFCFSLKNAVGFIMAKRGSSAFSINDANSSVRIRLTEQINDSLVRLNNMEHFFDIAHRLQAYNSCHWVRKYIKSAKHTMEITWVCIHNAREDKISIPAYKYYPLVLSSLLTPTLQHVGIPFISLLLSFVLLYRV